MTSTRARTPRIWPALVLEEGPTAAGFGPGDALCFAPGAPLSVLAVPLGARRRALRIRQLRGASDHVAHRILDDPPQLQASAPRSPTWAPAEAVHSFDGGRVRFVVDGPPLGTVKRFGPYLVCHCTEAGAAVDDALGYGPGAVCSRWVLPATGARDELVVIERADGEIVYRTEPRVVGHTLASMRALLAHGDALPPDIVARVNGDERIVIGFDGGGDDDIAAFLRAIDPDGAAREAALVEECGVLAAVR